MSDEEDVEVNVVSEADDSSSDGKKFKETIHKAKMSYMKKPEAKLGFVGKSSLLGNRSPEIKRQVEEYHDRRAEEWLELRGIDFEQWRKLSQQKFLDSRPRSPSPEIRKTEMTQTDSPKFKAESFCDSVSRSIELRRIQLGDFKGSEIRPKSPMRSRSPDHAADRSKSPNIDRQGKSPERNNYRCSKSRSRSPSPRSRSKSPASTPNPMYTSFTISSILRRTDSSVKKNSFSGNVQQNLVLDAATNFLNHHPACTDSAMLSR